MSTTMSIASASPDGLVEAERASEPRQAGLACVVGVGWMGGFAEADTPAMRAAAEASEARPINVEPQVYCRRYGAQHAATGLSPCSDLGCGGCTSEG